MDNALKLHDAELKFASIVWGNEPIHSRELAEICSESLGWKRSTSYTVLRKLCERGILRNDKAIVTSIAKKSDMQCYESAVIIEKAFDGSLQSFISAFLKTKKLTKNEAEEIQDLIMSNADI